MNISRENYKKISEDKPVPYCFEIKKRNQILFYFGANHSRDPKNKQYSILKSYWKRFLGEKTSSKMVVVEGSLRKIESTQKLAIQRGAEASLITVLAHKNDIPIICPEPSREIIAVSLQKNFSNDDIQYYYFAELVDGWYRYNPRPDFTPWAIHTMKNYAQYYNLKDFTLPKMKSIHKKLFKKSFSLNDPRFFNTITNPNLDETVINKISRTFSDIRDEVIMKRLIKEWKGGKSLFIVYGSGHAFIQEKILKKTLK